MVVADSYKHTFTHVKHTNTQLTHMLSPPAAAVHGARLLAGLLRLLGLPSRAGAVEGRVARQLHPQDNHVPDGPGETSELLSPTTHLYIHVSWL
jgi:hypothetical protein